MKKNNGFLSIALLYYGVKKLEHFNHLRRYKRMFHLVDNGELELQYIENFDAWSYFIQIPSPQIGGKHEKYL